MLIRDEAAADRSAVFKLVSAAFGQADEARLVQDLHRAGDGAIALVAEGDGAVLGHVLLSRMDAPFRALALAPLSVAPARQGQGIGASLVRAAIERARGEGWEAIFVLGDRGYYERFGFDAAAAEGFATPYAGAHFMVLSLTATLPARNGELRHAPAFAALG